MKSYAHIGTGNYNPATARLYTDLSLFTDDAEITQDISELFNYLTGFSKHTTYRKLLVAPVNLRQGIVNRIAREISHAKAGKPARIIWKINSLVDPQLIEQLYEASRAGVKIDLIVRGACCLRAGVPGISENIRVRSIIGRFLEHSRIYYFANDTKPDIYIGSADAMRRNFDRRVEVLVPVENKRLQDYLLKEVLGTCLSDNVKAWVMKPDGSYERPVLAQGEAGLSAQEWFTKNPAARHQLHKRS